jgi:hypothetical protein
MMSNQKLSHLFITMIIALSLFSCSAPADTPLPSIETPRIIENVQLQISSANILDEYEGYKPISVDDKLLVVVADLISLSNELGIRDIDLSSWSVSVIDENGREDLAVFKRKYSGLIGEQGQEDQGKGTMVWVFTVATSSQSFTLLLPGEQIVILDPLLRKQDTE